MVPLDGYAVVGKVRFRHEVRTVFHICVVVIFHYFQFAQTAKVVVSVPLEGTLPSKHFFKSFKGNLHTVKCMAFFHSPRW